MQRTLYKPDSVTGGATLIARGLRGQNTVFVSNNDANNDIYLAHDRLTLEQPRSPDAGIQGYKVAKATQAQIQDWVGDMWAVGSADLTSGDFEISCR